MGTSGFDGFVDEGSADVDVVDEGSAVVVIVVPFDVLADDFVVAGTVCNGSISETESGKKLNEIKTLDSIWIECYLFWASYLVPAA